MIVFNLKPILDARRMSIREFSRRVDYRFDAVRQFYNGTTVRLPIELLDRTCKELNCEPGELLFYEEGNDETTVQTKRQTET